MKKVFALVLAVSLVMGLATGAMAGGSFDADDETGNTGNVVVTYTAQDVIDVTVEWTDPTIEYEWNATLLQWVSKSGDVQAVEFSITNKSSAAKASMGVGNNFTSDGFVTDASFGGTEINPADNGTDTLTLELTENLDLGDNPISGATQTIPVVLTITNP